MKKNIGSVDQLVRLVASVLIVVLYFFGLLSGLSAVILLVVAGVLVLTSLVGFCPLYSLFGISSYKTRKKA